MKFMRELLSFQGTPMQVPPFSALKHKGVPLYTNMPDVENIFEEIPEK